MVDFYNMLNRCLDTVTLSPDKSRIEFLFLDGFWRSFGVEGDCCSTSWIEHLETPGDIQGAVLLRVEDSAPITSSHDENDPKYEDACIKVYNTRFVTSKGELILEFRNSSNGYYGGYLVDA